MLGWDGEDLRVVLALVGASGNEATLFCAADGIPKPIIKWYRRVVEVRLKICMLRAVLGWDGGRYEGCAGVG